MPQTQPVAILSCSLREMLREHEWDLVKRLADSRKGNLDIVAWSLGLITLAQLDCLLQISSRHEPSPQLTTSLSGRL